MGKTHLEILKEHPVIKSFSELVKGKYTTLSLVGGSLVDILEGREPKDFDFISESISDTLGHFISGGYEFVCDTSKAITCSKNGVIVQFLKTKLNDFDFKISQTRLDVRTNVLIIDNTSFDKKLLIPVSYGPERAMSSLVRIPHWYKKGYTIPEKTYQSLLASTRRGNKINIHS